MKILPVLCLFIVFSAKSQAEVNNNAILYTLDRVTDEVDIAVSGIWTGAKYCLVPAAIAAVWFNNDTLADTVIVTTGIYIAANLLEENLIACLDDTKLHRITVRLIILSTLIYFAWTL
ncbi:hypothetical protein ACH42_03440 [Endozoicomonas sp. (ex Bugula neritina AB1)]|nr:hypothetical protein ACH42_03440 [Endozoicomonas sp. (ex Bugula neritina AB1)]